MMNTEVDHVYAGNTVQKAAEVMESSGRGLLVVYHDDLERKLVGVISNKDIIDNVMAKKKSSEATFVLEVMTKKVLTITPDQTTTEAMLLMRDHNVKRIVVVKQGIVQGIISANDIINGMIKHKKDLLDLALDF